MREKGDLVVVLEQTPEPDWERHDLDLHHRCRISLLEALVGGKIPVSHPDGRTLHFQLTGTTQPDTILRAQGSGLRMPGGTGDLYLVFEVEFPKSLTRSQQDALTKALIGTTPSRKITGDSKEIRLEPLPRGPQGPQGPHGHRRARGSGGPECVPS